RCRKDSKHDVELPFAAVQEADVRVVHRDGRVGVVARQRPGFDLRRNGVDRVEGVWLTLQRGDRALERSIRLPPAQDPERIFESRVSDRESANVPVLAAAEGTDRRLRGGTAGQADGNHHADCTDRGVPHFFSVFCTVVDFFLSLTAGSFAVSAAGPMANAAWLVVMPLSAIACAFE